MKSNPNYQLEIAVHRKQAWVRTDSIKCSSGAETDEKPSDGDQSPDASELM